MKRTLATVVAGLFAAVAPTANAAEPQPLGHACTPQNGVRFCPGSASTRVPTFDGVPLDVDVTLPPSGDGPFPTLVMLHGWGGNKGNFEADGEPGADKYDNVHFARKGYAVVNHTARGFGNSCGSPMSRVDPGCVRGWLHLGDSRYEVHDTQHLLGLLVDEGVAKPDALGATGVSYGGGQSMQLAFLNDRVRQPDGSLVAWTSPKGTPLKLAAAWPRWPWSDLASALAPNGRFNDYGPANQNDALDPVGVPKTSYTSALYAAGNASGFYSPPGVDPAADLTTWFVETNRGEPETEAQRGIVGELHNFHSGMGVLDSTHPTAPVLIQNGWTDDLFPAPEGLRAYNLLRARPNTYVALQLGDLGHARGQNKQKTDDVMQAQGGDFLDAYLKGGSSAPASGTVTAMTQTCPGSADPGGPFTAASWAALHPGAVLHSDPTEQTISSDGGDPQVAQTLDPVAGGGACAQVDDRDATGTANYRIDVTQPFTLLGLPIVRATIATDGAGGQIAARLWDIAPDGKQVLVARGGYRLADDQKGVVTFQLYGNGYKFEAGHSAKLELLGRDAPFLRASNGRFSVKVSGLSLELPTLEKPGTGIVVDPLIGLGQKAAGKQVSVGISPNRVTAGKRYKFSVAVYGADCKGCSPYPLTSAKVMFGGKRYRVNSAGRLTVKRAFKKPGLYKVRAGIKGYPTKTVKLRVLKPKKKR